MVGFGHIAGQIEQGALAIVERAVHGGCCDIPKAKTVANKAKTATRAQGCAGENGAAFAVDKLAFQCFIDKEWGRHQACFGDAVVDVHPSDDIAGACAVGLENDAVKPGGKGGQVFACPLKVLQERGKRFLHPPLLFVQMLCQGRYLADGAAQA